MVPVSLRLLSQTSILLALGACSGSSTPAALPFTGFSDLPAFGTTQLQGQSVSASYTTDLSTGNVTVSNPSGPSASTASLTTENGNVVALSASAPGTTVNFDSRRGDTLIAQSGVIGAETSNQQDVAVFADPNAQGYEYQTYGAWITGYGTGSGKVGAGSFGSRTAAANVPSGTSATYNGASVGVARRADGQPYITSSNVSVSTDFSTVNVSSAGTQAVNANTGAISSAPELDFSGTGSVSGTTFTANVSGSGTNGRADGLFYGPQANEVGGTFQTTGSGGITHAGSFGGI